MSIKLYSVNFYAVISVSPWIAPRPIFWDSSPPPTFSCYIHSLFHDFLDWPCHKFYEGKYNTWTVFFSRNLLFGLSWAFCMCVCVTIITSSVVQSFQTSWCSIRVLFHSIDKHFHRVPCVLSPKGPSDLQADLEMLCLGERRPLWRLQCWTHGVLDGQGHCPISKEF